MKHHICIKNRSQHLHFPFKQLNNFPLYKRLTVNKFLLFTKTLVYLKKKEENSDKNA